MKAPTTLYLLMLTLVIALLPHAAHARRPMGTTMIGVVQKVDHTRREIVFAQEGGPVRNFVYTIWAKFWNDSPDSRPIALSSGMRIQVRLHRPLIGPDFVTQISLLQAARHRTVSSSATPRL
ncbi:MAG TPA: hypothetical protein DDZ88_28100 [Verrucomicrobiales bacterium]|nr:hypothetical protein [Verrucomicrobiales bacterium]